MSVAVATKVEPQGTVHTRTTAPPIRLEVSPSSGSAGTFDIRLGDRLLCTTEAPLLSAGRILLEEGVDPNAMLEMWWAGSTEFALRGCVREVAGLRVVAAPKGPPIFARFIEKVLPGFTATVTLPADKPEDRWNQSGLRRAKPGA